jgi:hypothetical protein
MAYSYDIRYVIVGQSPYPDDIVPYFGSAYSQCDGSVDTPTTRIICDHFDGSHENDVTHNLVRQLSGASKFVLPTSKPGLLDRTMLQLRHILFDVAIDGKSDSEHVAVGRLVSDPFTSITLYI